ncbi:MAG: CDP-alcohol phosphatidyltransferase family protein [Muribaculaceae bacterium]|nr:CDP-alcohol phosphatidyltransferase family protein [Muribaculaceae bacterium]
MKKKDKVKFSYKDSLKSLDTEETIDLLFYRPIGYFWSVLAYRLGVTPDAITIMGIFLGVGAGVCFFFPDMWWNLGGVALLMLANSFDSADGQLARMTHRFSRLGRILDGLCGDIWFTAIYAAICLRENFYGGDFFTTHLWAIWVLAAVTAIFHGIQAAMADYYRQFHLYFVKGKEGSELDTASDLWDKFHALSWRRNPWQKLVLMFYTNYTTGQEKRTPWMQRFRRELKAKFGDDAVPADLREKFRAQSKPLMKYTNILSFNTRTIALFVAILVFRQPWLYFAFEITVLNVVLVYMMWRHERICRRFIEEVKEYPASEETPGAQA